MNPAALEPGKWRPQASTSKNQVTNDSKATVSVLYWYGNYPNLTEQVSDFLGSGPALAPGQLLLDLGPGERMMP